MNCHSKKILFLQSCHSVGYHKASAVLSCKAFSLIETMTALTILAMVSASVVVVINRCMESAADSVQYCRAFEVARENMESLLASDSVEEKVEYGSSDKYPEIQWQKTVETFYEPVTSRMWVQAICSAEYTDTEGEVQKVALTHWLTDVGKNQLLEILNERQKEKELLEEGKAGEQEQEQGDEQIEQDQTDKEKESSQKEEPEENLICGYTMEELNKMDFSQIWEILSNCDEF